MDTNEGVVVTGRRRRRRHTDEFKAEAVRACAHPGVSMAAVALSFGINANLLRRWVVDHTVPRGAAAAPPSNLPAFVPVALGTATATRQSADTAPIHVELRRGAMTVNVDWPISASADCAAWLRELLR